MKRTDNFIGIFNQLESFLRNYTKSDNKVTFYKLLDSASQSRRIVRHNKALLQKFGDLRNLIVHNIGVVKDYIDESSEYSLKKLKAIAQDAEHFANEAGLYYLGYHFWGQKDYANARNYWQQLMVKYGMKESKERSGFAELAKPKLKLISAEW